MSTPVKPDITPYLEAIENAVYGEEVRGSIHDAIEAVNDYADEFYTDAQEQAQAAANSASDASGYATTASNKAGEASASATAAGNAETAAKNAKTDAIDAKNLANEYAGNAAASATQAAASAQAAAAAGPILKDTVGWMCKNRAPLTLDLLKTLNTTGTWSGNVYTLNDVTYTVNTNSDGYVTSIVMNGTSSGFTSLYLLNDTISNLSEFLPVGDYIVNGCPDGGGTLSGFSMRFKVDTATYIITDSTDMSVDVSGSPSDVISWIISCTSGTSVSSKTFKPMIRKAAIIDNSFESYHKSVEDWYWENNPNAGAKNLSVITEPSKTSNNIAFTVNGNKSVTATPNGTVTTVDTFFVLGKRRLKAGRYKVSKCQKNNPIATNSTYRFNIWTGTDITQFGTLLINVMNENEGILDLSSDTDVILRLQIYRDVTISEAQTFYPMIYDAEDTNPDYQPPAMTNEELSEKVTIFEYTPTYETGVSANAAEQASFKKMGDIKIIQVVLKGVTATAATWTKLLTLPNDMKPTRYAPFIAIKNNSSETIEGEVRINECDIRIRSANALSSDVIKFEVMYI